MSLLVRVGGKAVTLDDSALVGIGGEGRVFRAAGCAFKIYHPIDAALSQAVRDAQVRARALTFDKIRAFPKLPSEVIAPVEIVTSSRGEPLGFTMPLVVDGVEAARLAQRRYRDGVVSQSAVVASFARLAEIIARVHAANVVVGDLNDGNVLFVAGDPRIIDADSMQVGPYPCVVGHERYLDPMLYGVDLAKAPAFTRGSDWYAFAVMLFSSLLFVHPYAGSHASYKTVLRRAEARHSALRADVIYPKAAVRPETLTDAMLAWFSSVFDFGGRDAPPAAIFAARFTTCACGTEHARACCPTCTTKVSMPVTIHAGGLQVTRIATATGTILAAVVHANLKYLVETHAHGAEGALVRESGIPLECPARTPEMRAFIAGDTTWLAFGTRVLRFDRGALVATTSTSTWRDEPAFACNAHDAFRTDGDWLVSAVTGRRIGLVLGGQTFFRVGDAVGFGFYRTGEITRYFTFATARGGFFDVALAPLRGRVVAAEVTFDAGHALFTITTEERGRLVAAMHLVAADGTVVASMVGAPEDDVALASVDGKCLAFGVVLVAHEGGLVALKADAGSRTFAPLRAFPEARGHVSDESTLLAGPGGSLYVVRPREILQLSIS